MGLVKKLGIESFANATLIAGEDVIFTKNNVRFDVAYYKYSPIVKFTSSKDTTLRITLGCTLPLVNRKHDFRWKITGVNGGVTESTFGTLTSSNETTVVTTTRDINLKVGESLELGSFYTTDGSSAWGYANVTLKQSATITPKDPVFLKKFYPEITEVV